MGTKLPDIKWTIRLEVTTRSPKLSEKKIIITIKKILNTTKPLKLPLSRKCELGVIITDDQSIKSLNKKYRGKNKPTDVLSFSMIEGEIPLAESPNLGDLVISLPTAIKQSIAYDVNLYQELLRLMIHGLLHLLGYDHENVSKQEARKMQLEEERIYEKLVDGSRSLVIGRPR
jgi:probable rRNA maturation factor